MTDRIVSTLDPAIDAKKSKVDLYRQTQDPAHLVFVEGRKPIWYQFADLHYLDYQEVISLVSHPGLAADRAFRLGVIGIEGCAALSPDGAWRPTHERQRGGEVVKTITVEDMSLLFKHIAPKHLLDVGRTIVERAEAERPGNAAGRAG